ncbi:DNA ligase [uncultured archaeon]|nr:DNA ligase [uncultured archaeon]
MATFKEPMLAGKVKDMDINKITYPCYASAKLDGVRAIVLNGILVSRNLKPIPNAWVQKQFAGLPEGTDGELIFGEATIGTAYRDTMSAVMSEDGEPKQVCFHIFDNAFFSGGFAARFKRLEQLNDYIRGVLVVPHTIISDVSEMETVERAALEAGYEGIMVRSLQGPYKQGRSTTNEGYLLKLKRFEDAEAVVLDTFEWESNTNTATTSATGHTERSSHKAGMVGAGVLGGLDVRGLNGTYEGVEFSIGSGFQGADSKTGERGKLWAVRKSLVGRIVRYKYFPTGSKERPRFPIFLGWRDPIDL